MTSNSNKIVTKLKKYCNHVKNVVEYNHRKRNTPNRKESTMKKQYNVHVYNTVYHFHDYYTVMANDHVDAKEIALYRLVNETGHGLDEYEIAEAVEVQ